MGQTHREKRRAQVFRRRTKLVNPFKYEADRDGACPEYVSYLCELPLPNKPPINCQYLRVLPQDMEVIRKEAPPDRYYKGDLICLHAVNAGSSRRCGTSQEMVHVNPEGQVEILCKAGIRVLQVGERMGVREVDQ